MKPLQARCSLRSRTCVSLLCFLHLSSAEPGTSPASRAQTEELMQLVCSWASSGTTSNDITSICDLHRQQCSHLRETANRHLSLLAGKEAMRPCRKGGSDRAVHLSISSAMGSALASTCRGLWSEEKDGFVLKGFGGNLVRGSQAHRDNRGSMQ